MKKFWTKLLMGAVLGVMCLGLGAPPKRRVLKGSGAAAAAACGDFERRNEFFDPLLENIIARRPLGDIVMETVVALFVGVHLSYKDSPAEAYQAQETFALARDFNTRLMGLLERLYECSDDPGQVETLWRELFAILDRCAAHFDDFKSLEFLILKTRAKLAELVHLKPRMPFNSPELTFYLGCVFRCFAMIDFDTRGGFGQKPAYTKATKKISNAIKVFEGNLTAFIASVDVSREKSRERAAAKEIRRVKALKAADRAAKQKALEALRAAVEKDPSLLLDDAVRDQLEFAFDDE